jgi:CRP-like cAMP-binding protein
MATIDLFRNSTDYAAFEAGQIIFERGQSGDVMYAVVDGEVEILLGERVIDAALPGSIIGEMALIDSTPRSATARAKTACKLVPINEKRFLFLVQQTPYFAIQVMRILADRLRRLMYKTP